ncbi:MAG: hypothetical protein A3J55_01430 [Candidatus Ryanbacteria bacterium RIFCSPHIGHO2_02_FULL_45_17b]|uniref:Uncharacterized protein n=1 Tax=Candidatus Ryanbacteria bacterium RIFCSPHIGHO2_01_FULL_45_22 TaxID=1802114 RepID=A0A1G2G174_9BACT|nr:MAG: hypothetical protein A2719_03900 [Candidatus Ryanbacteria bacterium RIFCSPHIGHO2_01_FULL_45_22]OGZ47195.1 MAG: hypothetical protein A3J55_01430 [Candidatus Ryanbacteria bacterium RIFCSPHIGHO2_02_FULL_45_17b]
MEIVVELKMERPLETDDLLVMEQMRQWISHLYESFPEPGRYVLSGFLFFRKDRPTVLRFEAGDAFFANYLLTTDGEYLEVSEGFLSDFHVMGLPIVRLGEMGEEIKRMLKIYLSGLSLELTDLVGRL